MTGTKKIVAALALLFLAGLARADVRYKSTKFGFSVVLPGVPKTEEKSYPSPVGTIKQLNMMHKVNGKVYFATANALPAAALLGATDDDLGFFRDKFVEGIVLGMQGKVLSSTKFNDGKYTGTEVRIQGSNMTLVGRVFITNGKLYAMFTTESADANNYYKSFQIEKGFGQGR